MNILQKQFKTAALVAALLTTMSLSAPATAQEPGAQNAALDSTASAAELAAGASVLSSTVYATRILGMPEHIRSAMVKISEAIEAGQPGEEQSAPATDEAAGEADQEAAMSAGLFGDDSLDSSLANDDESIDSGASSALGSLDSDSNQTEKEGLGLSSAGRHGGQEMQDDALDIGRVGTDGNAGDNANPDLGNRSERKTVRRIIRTHREEVFKCFKKVAPANKGASGEVTIHFKISKTGNVLRPAVQTEAVDARAVNACVTQKMEGWIFPPPRSGETTRWNFPFHFSVK